ncbi:MAG: hypothetical protein IKO42_01095 [Opitutales bacterium]|nr:hypothetical protein [Opitutales bacterium]
MGENSNSEKVEAAVKYFRNPYSCAQAVYAAFAKNPSDEKLAYYKANSGGRCEGGFCGALFAARDFVPEKNRALLDEYFAKNAGALKCREIKTVAKTPCADCVKFAAQGVEKFAQ